MPSREELKMKGKYKNTKKHGKHLIVKNTAKSQSDQTPAKQEEVLKTTPEPPTVQKKKGCRGWLILLLAVLVYSFGFLSYGPAFIPKEKESDHKAFVVALEKSTETVIDASGRVVAFENTWGYPTARFVLINDYSLRKEEGRCVSYQVLFSFEQRRDCFAPTPKNEDSQELFR